MNFQFKSKTELRNFISENVLTSSESAEYLGITRSTFASLVKRQMLIPIKDAGGTRLFMRGDLDSRKETARSGRPFKN